MIPSGMFTIYGLYEAGKPDEIQYVGCTKRTLTKRLAGHLTPAYRPRQPVGEWVAKTAIECRTIQRVKDAQRAATIEKKWIAYYALRGVLLNVKDNPKAIFLGRQGPQPEDPGFGNETITNFLHYLRNLPIVIA